MVSVRYGLGRFGDRRLEKGGPICMPRWWRVRARVSVVLAADEPAKCSSHACCAIAR